MFQQLVQCGAPLATSTRMTSNSETRDLTISIKRCRGKTNKVLRIQPDSPVNEAKLSKQLMFVMTLVSYMYIEHESIS